MPLPFTRLFDPARFQGHLNKKNYFEGWYFKHTSADGKHVFALIPGVALNQKTGDSHAFIQYLNGKTGQTYYLEYPISDFHYETNRFAASIGPNHFSAEGVRLDTRGQALELYGALDFSERILLPRTLRAPGIMGWYGYVPFMECYHGVVNLDHRINGQLSINQQSINLDGGRGYIEKDWGRSFPSSWIWMQSNHFEKPGVSFMLSVARIPWLGTSFIGFLGFLLIDKKFKRFCTYTGARLKQIELQHDQVRIVLEDGKHRFEVEAYSKDRGELKAPSHGSMTRRVKESINSAARIRWSEIDTGLLLYEGTGEHAGLEFGGKTEELLSF